MYKIGVIRGDGIGPEVVEEAVKSLKAIEQCTPNISFEFIEFPFGWKHYKQTGELVSDRSMDELGKMDCLLLGALGHPDAPQGLLEQQVLLKIRFGLDQYVNLRPIKLYPNVACPLKGKGPADIDFYVVRENTEDFYVALGGRFNGKGKEKLSLKRKLYDCEFDISFESSKKMEYGYQVGLISEQGARRVIEYAFELAEAKGKTKVTSVDKANVLTHIYSLWRKAFADVAKNYPNISTEFNYVDAITMWFVKNPEWFQVVVTPNMFGDIITDLGAMIQGGLGLAPGGNINPKGVSMFEPIHGSAPKYAGLNVADPLATILAGQLMLDHLKEGKAAKLLDSAVVELLKEGKVLPKDLGGSASTSAVGDEVSKMVNELSEE